MSSITSCNEIRRHYGACGIETVGKMEKLLGEHSLRLTYDSSTQKFTVVGSARLNKEQIEEIFAASGYKGWCPTTVDETDASGNFKVRLSPITSDDGIHPRSREVRLYDRTAPIDASAAFADVNAEIDTGIEKVKQIIERMQRLPNDHSKVEMLRMLVEGQIAINRVHASCERLCRFICS